MKKVAILTTVLILALSGMAQGDREIKLVTGNILGSSRLNLFEKVGDANYGFGFQYEKFNNRLLLISKGVSDPGGITRMNFAANRNNGIGGAFTPGATLEIRHDSGSYSNPQLLLHENGGSTAYARISFQNSETPKFFTLAGNPRATSSDARLNICYSNPARDIMTYRGNGNVGIGTTAPGEYKLRVTEDLSSDAVSRFETTEDGWSSSVLVLRMLPSSPGNDNNYVVFRNGNGDIIGSIDGSGDGGVRYDTGGADLAEWLPRLRPEETIEPGDIVGIKGGKITKDTGIADYVQVVSTAPGWVGNWPGKAREALFEKVAFLGQAPVKVRGVVEAGDYVVASGLEDGTGVAVAPGRLHPGQYGKIVGKALESSDLEQLKTITTAVSVDFFAHEASSKKDLEIERLTKRIETLERLVMALKDRKLGS